MLSLNWPLSMDRRPGATLVHCMSECHTRNKKKYSKDRIIFFSKISRMNSSTFNMNIMSEDQSMKCLKYCIVTFFPGPFCLILSFYPSISPLVMKFSIIFLFFLFSLSLHICAGRIFHLDFLYILSLIGGEGREKRWPEREKNENAIEIISLGRNPGISEIFLMSADLFCFIFRRVAFCVGS